MKRIFIAIPISEKLQQGIIEWEKDFRKLPVRWLAGKNLHVTLIPPWEEDNITSVVSRLETIKSRVKPFDIVFKRVNYGPDPREPRLIWAENIPPKPAVELRDILESLFERKSDYRRWVMHITLARFDPRTFSSFSIKKLDETIWWPERVDSVVLMESHLLPGGSEYEVLKTVKLEG